MIFYITKDNFFERKKNTSIYQNDKKEFGEIDREVYERLNCAEMLHPDRLESYRQGGIGSWYDIMLYQRLLNKDKIKSKEIVKTSGEKSSLWLEKMTIYLTHKETEDDNESNGNQQ